MSKPTFSHPSIVKLLLGRNAAVNATDKHGITPLTWACFRGCLPIVKLLIIHGADIKRKHVDDWAVFRHSCRGDGHDIAFLIKERGAHGFDSPIIVGIK
jgi:ankyrin repeat protein